MIGSRTPVFVPPGLHTLPVADAFSVFSGRWSRGSTTRPGGSKAELAEAGRSPRTIRTSTTIAVLALLALLVAGGTSLGQYPPTYGYGYGYPRPGYGPPGSYFQPSGFSYTGLSPGSSQASAGDSPEQRQRLYDQCIATLKHIDQNNNGIIEPDELTGGKTHSHKQMFEEVVQKTGLPATVPMSVSLIRDRLVVYYRVTPSMPGPPPGTPGSTPAATPGGPGATGGQPSAGASPAAPAVPGFGVATALPAVPGFGMSAPDGSSSLVQGPGGTFLVAISSAFPSSLSAASSFSSAALTTGNSETDRKLRDVAKNVLQKYDRNKNGVLEKDEWSQAKSDYKSADRNGDDIITLDELTAYYILRSRSRSDSPAAGSSTSVSSPSSSAASSKPQQQPSYRFRTPSERGLPKGLPPWFFDDDLDKDGQVSMAEFASQWTDEKAAEFQQYDLNQDGYITTEECVKSLKLQASASSTTGRSRPATPWTGRFGAGSEVGRGGPPPWPGPVGKPKKKEPVASEYVPPAARDAIKRLSGNAELSRLEKEWRDEREIYTARWLINDREQEVKLAADGTVVERREIVGTSDLPTPVRQTAAQFLSGAENVEYKKKSTLVDGQMLVVYEVRGDVGGRKRPPIHINADGKME
jgi:hypothetical protein